MPTYTRDRETFRGEASDVTTREQRQTGRQILPWRARGNAGLALILILPLLVCTGCSAPDEKLPPRKAGEKAGKGAGASASQPSPTLDPQPLPADVPPRPSFAPAGLTDAEKLQARLRDECFEVAETLLADFPADPAGWTLLGAVHRYFGDDDGAEKLWNRALTLDANWPDAHRQLGNAAVERGDLDGAEAHYRLALDADPEALVVIDSLVETLLAKGDTAAADELLLGYLADHPRVVEAWCLLGKTRMVEGDCDAAREAFEKALEVEPTSRDASHGMAESLGNLGRETPHPVTLELEHRLRDRRDAAHPVRLLEALDGIGPAPWAATVNYWAAVAHARLGDATRAAIGWGRALELDPDDHDSREALATLYAETGRTREAMRLRQEWCDRDPANPAAWFGIGKLAYSLGLPEEAATALKNVVALAPERAEGHALLARAEATLDPAAALEAARRAADLDPTAPHLTLLGDTLFRGEQRDEAAAAYEHALALDPDDDRAKQALERLKRP
jgi:tetratricopeptide (TPR) repeat protein